MESPPHDRRCKRVAGPKSNGDKTKIDRESAVLADDRRCNRRAGAWQCGDEAVVGKPMCEHHLAQSESYKKKRTGAGDSESGEEGRKISAGGSETKRKRRSSATESESESEHKSKNRTVKTKVNGKSGDSGKVVKKSKSKEEKPVEKVWKFDS